jgi:hypothetical protein
MQLPVLLRPPSTRHSRVVLSEELLVKPSGQDAKDLHRVVRIITIDRLR